MERSWEIRSVSRTKLDVELTYDCDHISYKNYNIHKQNYHIKNTHKKDFFIIFCDPKEGKPGFDVAIKKIELYEYCTPTMYCSRQRFFL